MKFAKIRTKLLGQKKLTKRNLLRLVQGWRTGKVSIELTAEFLRIYLEEKLYRNLAGTELKISSKEIKRRIIILKEIEAGV